MRITAEQFKSAIDLLESFRKDYQFDEKHEDYLGFLNVGDAIITEDQRSTWNLICNRAQIFLPIIHELGLEIEGRLDVEETVFTLAETVS
jgi:hypothetical protein